MDAPDDRDVKVHRAAANLIPDLKSSLPPFLWRANRSKRPNRSSAAEPSGGHRRDRRDVRRRVRSRDSYRLISLIEPFQEWPQLLDPHLKEIVPPLVDAFLQSLGLASNQIPKGPSSSSSTIPLPRAICKILYTLCKVRGEKVIIRFLNNEPKYLELILDAFESWTRSVDPKDVSPNSDGPLVWEERYIILLWLSHLLLAPFDLSSLSSEDDSSSDFPGISLPEDLPSIARRLIPVGLKYLMAASKERDSAKALLVRLALRPDMRRLGLLRSLVQWALSLFTSQQALITTASVYQHVGVLSFLAGILSSAEKEAIDPYVLSIFRTVQAVATEDASSFENVRSSALVRKVIIKIFRSTTVLLLQSDLGFTSSISIDVSSGILEDVIDYVLTSLADKDTPVRVAASKALSIIAFKLDVKMAMEVVDAVVGSLSEDVLWEDPHKGMRLANFEVDGIGNAVLERNLSAVNPLRWHGLVLTLAQLLFRRSPPPQQLPEILNALILALGFEQRSATGSSIGTNVRDAACFGVWALSRKYTTKELLAVDTSKIRAAGILSGSVSVPQILATELLVSACLDPAGNIRRGSSAALQELIGRHPDTIIEGIPLVQAVDYHTVALRSRALTDVTDSAARLGQIYWDALFVGLQGWRGTGSADGESRKTSSQAIGLLSASRDSEAAEVMLKSVLQKLKSLKHREVEERHGLLLSLAAIIQSLNDKVDRAVDDASPGLIEVVAHRDKAVQDAFTTLSMLSDNEFISSALRPEVTSEAACSLISALARPSHRTTSLSDSQSDRCLKILGLCLRRSEPNVISASSRAAGDVFARLDASKRADLVSSWVRFVTDEQRGSGAGVGAQTFGYIAALGCVFQHVWPTDENASSQIHREIIDALVSQSQTRAAVEIRVAAVRSLENGVFPAKAITPEIRAALRKSLKDYTVDQRGDVGSWIRLAAIDAISSAWNHGLLGSVADQEELLSGVCRLAAEKLDKVRFRAWLCLQEIWVPHVLSDRFTDLTQVSSLEYFRQLLSLLSNSSLQWTKQSILEGYITSAGVGSESVLRASRLALARYADSLPLTYEAGSADSNSLISLFNDLSTVLRENSTNDRVAIPMLEVLGYLCDARITQKLEGSNFKIRTLLSLLQKAHYKSPSIPKLEAAVRLYTGLVEISSIRDEVVRKLASMLVHPFPMIRNSAAEALFISAQFDLLENYTQSPTQPSSHDANHVDAADNRNKDNDNDDDDDDVNANANTSTNEIANTLKRTDWSAAPRDLRSAVEDMKTKLLAAAPAC
ncbi:MAG: hypothetical protein M1819_005451 [Sarea resinae]|nr:MAG: hypothetical protein M1819_005451 [Sarea resinae]